MKASVSLLRRARGVGCVLGSSVMLVLAGCEPLSEESIGELVLDFARGAIAAWLM